MPVQAVAAALQQDCAAQGVLYPICTAPSSAARFQMIEQAEYLLLGLLRIKPAVQACKYLAHDELEEHA